MYLITILTLFLRHLGPDSSLPRQFTSVRQSRSELPLVTGVGGSAQDFSGPPMQSSSTIGNGTGRGSAGMSPFIRMPTNRRTRLDPAGRSVTPDGTSALS